MPTGHVMSLWVVGLLMLMGQDVQAFSDFLFYVLGTHVSWQQFFFEKNLLSLVFQIPPEWMFGPPNTS